MLPKRSIIILLSSIAIILLLTFISSKITPTGDNSVETSKITESVTQTPEPSSAPTAAANENTPPPIRQTPTKSPEELSPVYEKVICIDAGHGLNPSTDTEPIAPSSSKEKRAFVSGTAGASQTEEQLVLKLAMALQANLTKLGANVHMTRTDHKTTLSNIGRAELANSINAELTVKIHADGGAPSAHGISVLVPSNEYLKNDFVYTESRKAGEKILSSVIEKTGAYNRGISERSDLTGFNWSKVPVILIETGFMTNPDEDKLLETDEYRIKLADGMTEGIINYFSQNTQG